MVTKFTFMGTLLTNEEIAEFICSHPVSGGCGAPSGQTALATAQTAYYNNLTSEEEQIFSQDEGVFNDLQSIYGPIFQKGPNQLGFSAGEDNELNSSAATGVGESFEAADQSAKENIASEGGGTVMLPSGVQTKLAQGVSTAGAAQLSGEENQIEQADYQQGYNEFEAATNALLGSTGVFSSSTAAAGAANQGGSAANQTYTDIAQENESPFNAVVGALGGVAGDVVNENPGGVFGPGCWMAAACFDEDFYTGEKTAVVRNWLWNVWSKNFYAKPVLWFYSKFGKWASRQGALVTIFKPLFNSIYERAK